MKGFEELDKLEAYLTMHGYTIHRIDYFSDLVDRHQIIVYDSNRNRLWDAICQMGSYGYEQGLLEIYGSIVDPAKDNDTVVGCLTAEDVIKRIEG